MTFKNLKRRIFCAHFLCLLQSVCIGITHLSWSSHTYVGCVGYTCSYFWKPCLHRLTGRQCSVRFQCGVLRTTLDILEFSSKFYLIFNVCSDTENDNYITIGTSVHNITVWLFAQRYAITYFTLLYNNYSNVRYVYLWRLLNYTCLIICS